MYGTVAKIRVKKGALEALKKFSEAESGAGMSGYRGQVVYQMDRDPDEIYLVVIFDSREAYFANAESPEQHARYLEMMKLLEGEPEWNDGKVIFSEFA